MSADCSHAEPRRRGEVKPSGIAWFGDVPEGWKVRKLFGSFTENKDKNKYLTYTRAMQFNYGRIVDKNESLDLGEVKEIYSKYSLVRKNDIIINGLNLNYDFVSQRVAISPKEGIITSAYIALRPRQGISPSYYCYLFKSMDSKKMFHGLGTGIRLTLSFKELRNLPLPVPPLPEQEAIVKYLDEATGKIDKAIAAEEKMVALLQERREIVINEAVGGGYSHAEEQRGGECRELPRGWKCSTIKRYFDITLGKMLCSRKLSDDYTLEKYFCAADVHFGDLNITDNKQMWFSRKEREQYLIKNGDLLIVEGGAGAGGACVVNGLRERFYIQNSILRLRSRGGASEQFVCYLLEGIVKRGYIEMACNKATIPHFTKEKAGEVPLVLPPLPEQEAIVKRLDEETGKIDRAIAVKRRQIELLRERREIIINEVVTGKVKVA